MLRRNWARILANSSALQKGVERVEAFKAAAQNFFIRHSFFRPSLKDAIESDAFGLLKFFVLEVGVMDHLADFPDGFVADGKAFCECLVGAVFVHVRKLGIEHVERNRFRSRRNFWGESEARFRIDELTNQPRRADAIDLRMWPGEPGAAALIFWMNFRERALGNGPPSKLLQ